MTDADFKDFLVSYRYEGADWGATIKAQSFDDAKRRIEAMGAWGKIDGEHIATIPASLGPLVRLVVWLRNMGRLQ